MRTNAESGVIKSHTKECQQCQKPPEAQQEAVANYPSEPCERTRSTDTWILKSWPPKFRRNKSLLL